MRQLPEEKRPRRDSDGEKYRELQLVYQLPKQDLSLSHCHHMGGDEQRAAFSDFVSARNALALDVGRAVEAAVTRPCRKCRKPVAAGALAVVAPRLGLGALWHPGCFTCSTCEELLVSESAAAQRSIDLRTF